LDVLEAICGQKSAERWWLITDLPVVVFAFAFPFVVPGEACLKVDAIFAFILGLVILFEDVNTSADKVACNPTGMMLFPNVMMLTGFFGVHGLAIAWLWFCSAVVCLSMQARSQQGFEILCNTTLVCMGCLALEFTVSALYREWHNQLQCTQTLLDSATDGFGLVDVDTGIISDASTKMLQTLGYSQTLVGHGLESIVDARDRASLAQFFGDARSGAPPSAVLVTCKSAAIELEVRLIPYRHADSQIAFCMQQVGEARRFAAATLPGAADGAAGRRFESAMHGHTASDAGSAQDDGAVEEDAEDSVSQVFRREVAVCEDVDAVPPLRHVAAAGSWLSVTHNGGLGLSAHSHSSGFKLSVPPLPLLTRSLGSLSLSSWTASCEGAASLPATAAGGGSKKSKAVETKTVGIQVPEERRPPAPLAASSVPTSVQERKRRKRRMAKVLSAVVAEGQPRFAGFPATPRSTRWNSLCQLARSCNVTGTGCCPKHVAWMSLYVLILEELVTPCSGFRFYRDWQCPECHALNASMGDGDGDDDEEKLCAVCCEIVEPLMPSQDDDRDASQEWREPSLPTGASVEGSGDSSITDSQSISLMSDSEDLESS